MRLPKKTHVIHVVSQRRAGAGLLLQILRAHPVVAAAGTCIRASVDDDEIRRLDMEAQPERALCLHRHCLDVVASNLHLIESHATVGAQGRERHDADVEPLIERWSDSTEVLLAFEAVNPTRTFRLRYEDLVGVHGERGLRAAFNFLDLEWANDLVVRLPDETARRRFWYLPNFIRCRVKSRVERIESKSNGRLNAPYSVAILPDRVGRRRMLDLRVVALPVLNRMNRLLNAVGYS